STVDDLGDLSHAVTLGLFVILVGALVTRATLPGPGTLAAFATLTFAAIVVARAGGRAFVRRSGTYAQATIIVGAGDVGRLVARKATRHPEYGLDVIGFVDSHPMPRRDELENLTVLGEPAELRSLVERHGVERVVLAFSQDRPEAAVDLIRELFDLDV